MDTKLKLPAGWAVASVADLVGKEGVFSDGDWVESKDQDPNGDVRLTQLADVGDGEYRNRSSRFLTRERAIDLGCTFLERGDVMIARMPDPLGRACVFPGDPKPAVTVVDVCVVRPHERVSRRWLASFVNSIDFRHRVAKLQKGTTRKRISRKNLATIPLPTPPTNEQRRIVAKLEELFSRLDAGVAALEGARAKLKRLRAGVLKSAVEGRLTADWRATHPDAEPAPALLQRILAERHTRWIDGQLTKWRQRKAKAGWADARIDEAAPAERKKLAAKYEPPKPPATDDLPELPATWCWATVEALQIESSINGISVKGSDSPPGVPALKLSAMRDYGFDYAARRYIPIDESTAESLAIKERDFFVSRGNGSLHLVGKGVLAKAPTDRIVFPDTMIRLRFSHLEPIAAFLASLWSSRIIRQQIEKRARTTAGIYKISQRDVDGFVLPLPPLAEQAEIVRRVDEQLSRIDAAEKAIDAALARAKRLRQAILKRAFEGRLVPQDPSDEPASVLLERIRAERGAAAVAFGGKRGRGAAGGEDAPARRGRKGKSVRVAAAVKTTPPPIAPASPNPQPPTPRKQLSLLGDDPAGTASIDPALVAEAFRLAHDGYSTDYVLACPEANARFLDAAARLGIDAPALAVNKQLLVVRKTMKGSLPAAAKRYHNPTSLAPFEFVAEWAARIVQQKLRKELGREPSLDTLLCDPALAERFDEVAARLKALEGEALPYRWIALGLRKRKATVGGAPVEFGAPLPLEEAAAAAPERPGVYQVRAGDRPLYVGETTNLREQLLRHGLTTGDPERVVPDWVVRGEPQSVAMAATRQDPSQLAGAARTALRPRLNVTPA